jgi:DNA-binding response OmpR family regulator
VPRILVVEDDYQVRAMLRLTLERLGYEVEEAANGAVACEKFRRRPFDLTITDIVMPEKEGIGTIIELRREFPGAKIIAISGGARGGPDIYLDSAERFGAARTFTKPVDPNKLLLAVRELLSEPVP